MNLEMSQSWVLRKIEHYKETGHYSRLIEALKKSNYTLSDDAMFKVLSFSADIYQDVERDSKYIGTKYEGTFWNRLSPFFMENPFLFSISEIAELTNSIKFLIFVKPKWFPIAKNIVDKYQINYRVYEASGAGRTLMAFSFFQAYKSYDDWNNVKNARMSTAQKIQHDIQRVNGITADLFSLWLPPNYRASFAILSPGSVLELFTGEDRDFYFRWIYCYSSFNTRKQ